MSVSPQISLEFFPPKGNAPQDKFWLAIDNLAALKPQFMTVTYGAGGSTRDWTLQTSSAIQSRTGINTAAHLTCVNTMKDGIHDIARTLWENGVKHIVALRGDIPDIDAPLNYNDKSYYHYANELIAGLRLLHDFEISVAAYPEKHPEAPSIESDIIRLRDKCNAGAARAITQFFFDNDVYYRFLDKCTATGITTPIVPGLLPIVDFKRMQRVAATCQANVPQWLHDKFSGLDNNPDEARKVSEEIIIKQTQDLLDHGINHVHFYTLNRADLTAAACKATGLAL